jgi:hypothetical protein
MLVSTDSRGRNLVRKTLQGSRRKVLHLHLETLIPRQAAQPAQPAQRHGGMQADGPLFWAGSGTPGQEPAHGNGPSAPMDSGSRPVLGPNGPVGPVSKTYEPPEKDILQVVAAEPKE